MRLAASLASFLIVATTVAAQPTFEQAAKDLSSADAGARLRAARLLKDAAYEEAAIPLVPLVNDSEDAIQLEAIAAELNIFLAEKVTTRRRIGLVIEVRNKIAAEAAFSAGPQALSARAVPIDVLTALRTAVHDDNPRVAIEALYAFGALSASAAGSARRELQRASATELAALLGVPEPELRVAALRVIASVFARQPQDPPMDETAGDGVIAALNDNDRTVRTAAMDALGVMRYERAVTALTELFQYYGRNELGQAALNALARIGHPASAPVFAEQLTGRNAALKLTAIEGLARIGDRTAETAIQSALTSERNEAVQLAGVFASVLLANAPIDTLTAALSRPRLRDQAVFYLTELAGHADKNISSEAARAIALLSNP
jgi:HEAT repeat protein